MTTTTNNTTAKNLLSTVIALFKAEGFSVTSESRTARINVVRHMAGAWTVSAGGAQALGCGNALSWVETTNRTPEASSLAAKIEAGLGVGVGVAA